MGMGLSEETNTQKVTPKRGHGRAARPGWAQPQADCGRVWVSLGGCWTQRFLRHALSGRGSPGTCAGGWADGRGEGRLSFSPGHPES